LPVSAQRSKRRFIVDTASTEWYDLRDVQILYDFSDTIGFAVVHGSDSDLPDDVRYTADILLDYDVPAAADIDLTTEQVSEPLFPFQWDKREQDIETVHQTTTGEGARIGVIDDGVLGANPTADVEHPDLPNVLADQSVNLTDDRQGPGPLGDDHGTHVAGTAAAAVNGAGVRGMAPDAEIVDLRVFSGEGASFADVNAAVMLGAMDEDERFAFVQPPSDPGEDGEDRGFTNYRINVVSGADCDVLNLSLGSGPIPEGTPGLDVLRDMTSAAGRFAVENGTLPIAAAGNDATDVDDDVVVLPAEADGFMSVGATGPIGYGWPPGEDPDTVAGMSIESAIDPELGTAEPVFYTNYGAEGVDVTAGGGNQDGDAAVAGVPGFFYDLVLSTTFQPVYDVENPDERDTGGDGDGSTEDERPARFVPTYGYKAGTSFACPNVAGIAALLFAQHPSADPETVRTTIEEAAVQLPVGDNGVTTAPSVPTDFETFDSDNEATDGDFDGDGLSSPGQAPGPFDSAVFRGQGHVDTLAAVQSFTASSDDDSNDRDAVDAGSH
jgi:hypothetical protein